MAAFSNLQLAMFGVGVAILMAGIYFLIPPDSDTGKAPQVPAALLHKCCGNSSVMMQAQGRLYCWRTRQQARVQPQGLTSTLCMPSNPRHSSRSLKGLRRRTRHRLADGRGS